MRSMPMPRRNHQTASLLKLNKACAEAKGTPIIAADVGGQAALLKKPFKCGQSVVFPSGRKRLTSEEKTAGSDR
jgi:hypothetical protein